MTSLICLFVCCGFVTNCQRGRLLGHMCFHLLRTYVTYLCKLANPFDKTHSTCNWVVLGVFNTSRNNVSRSSVEVIKSVQEKAS